MTLPVPSQRTWTTGDIVTAAMMNANVRDAVNFLAQPPLFVGYQATAQAIPATAWTAINLDSSVADTYSGHSNTVNNSRYTAQVAGWYFMFGVVAYSSNATGVRFAAFYVNGSANIQLPASSEAAVSGYQTLTACAGLVYLPLGSYVELRSYQNGANPLNTMTSTGQSSYMAAWWMHA